jgi:hypothetical protein
VDAYQQLAEEPIGDGDTVVPWLPTDDELLPGRRGRIAHVVGIPAVTEAPAPAERPVVTAEPRPAAAPLLLPAAADAPTADEEFWRPGLAPLPDFADVRAMADQPIDY